MPIERVDDSDGNDTTPTLVEPPAAAAAIEAAAAQRRTTSSSGATAMILDGDAAVADDDDDDDDVGEEDDSVAIDDDPASPPGTGAVGAAGTSAVPPALATTLHITAEPHLDSLYGLREVGKEAICWQLSSAKPGNGVEQLRDRTTETYWQSDGTQPHTIQIQFARRAAVSHVCLYLDYNLDESYTPKRIEIQAGMTIQDLRPAVIPVDLNEPVGWCIVPLTAPTDPLLLQEEEEDDVPENEDNESLNPVRAHLIQISILSMHQNGRDTHVRQVQLYGPRRGIEKYDSDNRTTTIVGTQEQRRRLAEDWSLCRTPEFTTVEMSQYSSIR